MDSRLITIMNNGNIFILLSIRRVDKSIEKVVIEIN